MPKNKSKSTSTRKQKQQLLSPNLPTQLLTSTLPTNNLTSRITSLGTTKYWLTTSSSRPRCINTKHPHYPQLAHVPDSTTCKWNYNGWDFTGTRRHSSEGERSCTFHPGTLTLFTKPNPAFTICMYTWTRSGQNQMITHVSTTRDLFGASDQFMTFTNVVRCDGKLYALSLQGCLVELAECNAEAIVTGVCRTRAVPSVYTKYFKEYMFESRGQVFLVFLIYRKLNGDIADEVEVFRLDVGATFDLVKVDKIGGRVLFLDKESCLWTDSEELDCKGDCIYFTGGLDDDKDGWWRYDIESKSISTAWKKRTRWIGRYYEWQTDMEPD